MYLNWLEHFVISFIKIKNRRWPKIDPCGTPHWITLGFESTLFIDMYCSLFVRYEQNQSKAIPQTPQVFTLIAESRGQHNQMPCENQGTKKIQYYQSLYAYTSTARN